MSDRIPGEGPSPDDNESDTGEDLPLTAADTGDSALTGDPAEPPSGGALSPDATPGAPTPGALWPPAPPTSGAVPPPPPPPPAWGGTGASQPGGSVPPPPPGGPGTQSGSVPPGGYPAPGSPAGQVPPIFGPPTGGPGEPPPAYQGAGYPGAGYQGPGYQTAAPSTLLNATEAVQYGWRALMNNIGPLVLITLVVLAVDVVTGLISRQTDNTFLAFFMQIVTWLVTSVVAFGLVRAALAIVDGRAPVVADLFNTDRIVPYLLASIMFSIAVTLGLILCVIPGLVVGFLLWFFAYAILDSPPGPNSPASSPVAALRRSYELTSAHAGELLMLALICLVLNIVGALFCGLGLLVSLPVTAIATAWAWRRMTGGTIAPQAQ